MIEYSHQEILLVSHISMKNAGLPTRIMWMTPNGYRRRKLERVRFPAIRK